MKRSAIVGVAVAALMSSFLVGPAAFAGTSNADGTQPVIASQSTATCAVRDTGQVYCFGYNGAGGLGRGTTSDDVRVLPVSGLTRAAAVYGGDATACAITTARLAYCWGANFSGTLGSGSHDDSSTPVQFVGVTNIASMGMSATATCAVKQDGSVWCAGNADYGVIPGKSGIIYTPTKIAGISSVTQVALGNAHACAIRADRSVWCWGYNSEGQLGRGSVSGSPSAPAKVPGISDAVAIAAGAFTSCALRATGTVWCWGYSLSFETGTGTTSSVLSPTAVPGVTAATGLTFGFNSACAWSSTTVRCWGYGGDGQLGDGQENGAPWPTRVEYGKSNPTAVSAGTYTTCEIANGDRIWCWGKNSYGEAGTGNLDLAYQGAGPGSAFGYAATPVKVPLLNSKAGTPSGASKATKKISISWAAPSASNGTSAPTDYVVQYKLKGTTAWKTFKDAVTATRSATVTGLTKGKYYQFRVYPKNWAGTGSVSMASGYIKSK